jgi:integrase
MCSAERVLQGFAGAVAPYRRVGCGPEVVPHRDDQGGDPRGAAGGRFKRALREAGVREVRFHDLRHSFGTRMAAAGVPLRTLQEWLGHRDFKTTLRYADYAPSAHEGEMVERAFALGSNLGSILSETQSN